MVHAWRLISAIYTAVFGVSDSANHRGGSAEEKDQKVEADIGGGLQDRGGQERHRAGENPSLGAEAVKVNKKL